MPGSYRSLLQTLKALEVSYRSFREEKAVDMAREKYLFLLARIEDQIEQANELPGKQRKQLKDFALKKQKEIKSKGTRRKDAIYQLSLRGKVQDWYRLSRDDIQLYIDRKKLKRDIACYVIDGETPIVSIPS